MGSTDTAVKQARPYQLEGPMDERRQADQQMDDDYTEDVRPYTDEALALEFARRHGPHVRYVAVWSKWMLYNGIVWRRDETLKVFTLSRALCREQALEAP